MPRLTARHRVVHREHDRRSDQPLSKRGPSRSWADGSTGSADVGSPATNEPPPVGCALERFHGLRGPVARHHRSRVDRHDERLGRIGWAGDENVGACTLQAHRQPDRVVGGDTAVEDQNAHRLTRSRRPNFRRRQIRIAIRPVRIDTASIASRDQKKKKKKKKKGGGSSVGNSEVCLDTPVVAAGKFDRPQPPAASSG